LLPRKTGAAGAAKRKKASTTDKAPAAPQGVAHVAPSGDLMSRIQQCYGELRKSERIVADYLREHHSQRIDLSITELARTIGASEATISRVSRTLGYRGFPDLKLASAEGAMGRAAFANIPSDIGDGDSLLTVSTKLAHLLAKGLRDTELLLDAQKLKHAVTELKDARKILFVGIGGAAAICNEAAHMFMKAGLDAVSFSDGYTQIIAGANTTADCTVVGISHTGTTDTVAQTLRIARDNGAMTIAIVGDPLSAVARSAQLPLITASPSTPSVPMYGDFIEGRMSQLFLIDLLYIGVLFELGERTAKHLQLTAKALQGYFKNV
jgi:RpiR family transcriptional regulator, carbohydrate utilization regulator